MPFNASVMLSVESKPIMQSVVMLSVVMLSVVMLSVVMLSVIILSIVANYRKMFDKGEVSYIDKGPSLSTNANINCKTI